MFILDIWNFESVLWPDCMFDFVAAGVAFSAFPSAVKQQSISFLQGLNKSRRPFGEVKFTIS